MVQTRQLLTDKAETDNEEPIINEGQEASDRLRALANSLGLTTTDNTVGVWPYWSAHVGRGKVISFHPVLSSLEIKYGYEMEPRKPITEQKAISLMRRAAR